MVAHGRGRRREDLVGRTLLVTEPNNEDRAQVLRHNARARVLEEEAGDPLAEGTLCERAHGVARARVVQHVVLVGPDRQVELRELAQLVEEGPRGRRQRVLRAAVVLGRLVRAHRLGQVDRVGAVVATHEGVVQAQLADDADAVHGAVGENGHHDRVHEQLLPGRHIGALVGVQRVEALDARLLRLKPRDLLGLNEYFSSVGRL
eukprot:scaffold8467_cov64-Phaeocystis_antarctica.AAC.8